MQTILVKQLPLAPISFMGDKVPASDLKYLKDDSGIIVDTSALYGKENSAECFLLQALSSIRKKTAFEQIVSEYRSLHIAAVNMTNYLTQLVPGDGGVTLLNKCLLSGIEAFSDAHKEHYLNNDPSIKIAAFIKGASQAFHEILFNSIYGRHENAWVQWKPMSEPIYDWVVRHQFEELLIVPTSSKITAETYNTASNKLLYEVFSFSDLSFCGISAAKDKALVEA